MKNENDYVFFEANFSFYSRYEVARQEFLAL